MQLKVKPRRKMLRIHVPTPLQIKEGRARPLYCTEESGCIDLSVLKEEQAQITGSR